MGNHLCKQGLKLNWKSTREVFHSSYFFTEYGWLFLHLACLQSVFWISLIAYILPFTSRNSRPQMFFRIGGLKNLANCTEKHLCRSIFLIQLRAFRTPTQVFAVKFAEFLRTPFFHRASAFCLSAYRDFWRN